MNQQEIFTYIQKQYPTHVDGQAEADGETRADRQTADSTTEEKD